MHVGGIAGGCVRLRPCAAGVPAVALTLWLGGWRPAGALDTDRRRMSAPAQRQTVPLVLDAGGAARRRR